MDTNGATRMGANWGNANEGPQMGSANGERKWALMKFCFVRQLEAGLREHGKCISTPFVVCARVGD
jgi:hypothetical protein